MAGSLPASDVVNAFIEIILYLLSSSFSTSVLLYLLKVNPWFWHSMALALAFIPLAAIAILAYKPKPEEDDFLSALRQKEDNSDKNSELIATIFKWWILRTLPIATGIQLVFWGWL